MKVRDVVRERKSLIKRERKRRKYWKRGILRLREKEKDILIKKERERRKESENERYSSIVSE